MCTIANIYRAESSPGGFLVWAHEGTELKGAKVYVEVTDPSTPPFLVLVELVEVRTASTEVQAKNGQVYPATVWQAVRRKLTGNGWE